MSSILEKQSFTKNHRLSRPPTFELPKMGSGGSGKLIPVKSLMRSTEIIAFDAKAKKHGKAPILVPTTTYKTSKGTPIWVAEFRDQVPQGTKLIRDGELDLIPIPVISGG